VSFPARAALRDSWLRPSALREGVLALLSRAFFARVPSTMMTSPILSVVLVQPCLAMTEGAPISKAQFSTRPESGFFTSM